MSTSQQKIYSYKIAKRNELIFYKKLIKDKGFFIDLNLLSLKYFGKEIRLETSSRESLNEFVHRAKVDDIFEKNLESLSKTEGFFPDLKTLINKHSLGNEWIQTITLFLISDILYFPAHNLHINKISAGNGKFKLNIELNRDTTIADIKSAWPKIQKLQKELKHPHQGTKLTKKSFRNLSLYINDINNKNSNKEYRKLKDIDKMAILFPNSEDDSRAADRRRSQNVRQLRHRWKRDKN